MYRNLFRRTLTTTSLQGNINNGGKKQNHIWPFMRKVNEHKGGIATVLGALVAWGGIVHYIKQRQTDVLEVHFDSIDKQFEGIDKQFEGLNKKLKVRSESIDKHFDAIDKQFEGLNKHIEVHNQSINKQLEGMSRQFDRLSAQIQKIDDRYPR